MSTSFSSPFSGVPGRVVANFHYRDSGHKAPPLPHVKSAPPQPEPSPAPPGVQMTERALADLLTSARVEAAAAATAAVRAEYEREASQNRTAVAAAVAKFAEEAATYYARVEKEVVQLALSIAAKILHREAQVDPMLVAALVQFALGQWKEGTTVLIRVRPEAAAAWRAHFAQLPQRTAVSVAEDGELPPGGCMLETELGSADFSLAAQLKEVEQGFFDVLAQTPRS